jgi:nucleoside-diphosphate-sugar epimerase
MNNDSTYVVYDRGKMAGRILITGANGFIGQSLCKKALSEGWHVRGTIRTPAGKDTLPAEVDAVIIDGVGPGTDWTKALAGVDTVVHLAARVHVMRETASNPLMEFRRVNTHGTVRLARMAAASGVGRFIFLSTVGVNGNATPERPFTEMDLPQPHNAYAVSKFEAELSLRAISDQTELGIVIIRAPLVYGPANPGNFLKLLNLVAKRLPLPLASVRNRRSLMYLENLVDAIITCTNRPEAAGKTYLVSDGDDVSTPELIRRIADALGVPAILSSFPVSLLHLAGKLLGKSAEIERLIGSLIVDSTKIRTELGWKPPFGLSEGLKETAMWYKEHQK